MCKNNHFEKEKAILTSFLLERVDLKDKIVTADVFLQTSLQSPQHLHLEDYTWTQVKKEHVVYNPILWVCYVTMMLLERSASFGSNSR